MLFRYLYIINEHKFKLIKPTTCYILVYIIVEYNSYNPTFNIRQICMQEAPLSEQQAPVIKSQHRETRLSRIAATQHPQHQTTTSKNQAERLTDLGYLDYPLSETQIDIRVPPQSTRQSREGDESGMWGRSYEEEQKNINISTFRCIYENYVSER